MIEHIAGMGHLTYNLVTVLENIVLHVLLQEYKNLVQSSFIKMEFQEFFFYFNHFMCEI